MANILVIITDERFARRTHYVFEHFRDSFSSAIPPSGISFLGVLDNTLTTINARNSLNRTKWQEFQSTIHCSTHC